LRQSSIIGVILVVLTVTASGNSAPPPQASPKEVIVKYWKFETAGGRLTTDGWENASGFFVKLGRPPLERRISVIAGGYAVSDVVINGNSADVMIQILPQGQIDSKLKFTPSAAEKGAVACHLILSGTYWSTDAGAEAPVERTGPPEWRIDGSGEIIWLEPIAAVRYVTDMKRKSNDPIVTKNADQTLSELAKLH